MFFDNLADVQSKTEDKNNILYGVNNITSYWAVLRTIPKNCLQVQHDQIPFFIKPNKADVSSETYMYVYGIDYEGFLKKNNFGSKLDSLIKANKLKLPYL